MANKGRKADYLFGWHFFEGVRGRGWVKSHLFNASLINRSLLVGLDSSHVCHVVLFRALSCDICSYCSANFQRWVTWLAGAKWTVLFMEIGKGDGKTGGRGRTKGRISFWTTGFGYERKLLFSHFKEHVSHSVIQ